MKEILLFSIVLVTAVVFFILLRRHKAKKTGQPTQNYDDRIDRVVEQLDNL